MTSNNNNVSRADNEATTPSLACGTFFIIEIGKHPVSNEPIFGVQNPDGGESFEFDPEYNEDDPPSLGSNSTCEINGKICPGWMVKGGISKGPEYWGYGCTINTESPDARVLSILSRIDGATTPYKLSWELDQLLRWLNCEFEETNTIMPIYLEIVPRLKNLASSPNDKNWKIVTKIINFIQEHQISTSTSSGF